MNFDYYTDTENALILGIDAFSYSTTERRQRIAKYKESGVYIMFHIFKKQYVFHFYRKVLLDAQVGR